MAVVVSGMCIPSSGLDAAPLLLLGRSLGLDGCLLQVAAGPPGLVMHRLRDPEPEFHPVLLVLPHACPSWCLAGRSALPLEPGDGGHRGMPTGHQGQAVEPTKSAMHDLAGRGRLRCRVGW